MGSNNSLNDLADDKSFQSEANSPTKFTNQRTFADTSINDIN